MQITTSSINEQFEKVCRDFHEKAALIYLGRRYSYSQLHEATENLAGSLHRLGVSRGDKAVLYLSNCPQWVIAWFALLRIGAVAIPILEFVAHHPVDLSFFHCHGHCDDLIHLGFV